MTIFCEHIFFYRRWHNEDNESILKRMTTIDGLAKMILFFVRQQEKKKKKDKQKKKTMGVRWKMHLAIRHPRILYNKYYRHSIGVNSMYCFSVIAFSAVVDYGPVNYCLINNHELCINISIVSIEAPSMPWYSHHLPWIKIDSHNKWTRSNSLDCYIYLLKKFQLFWCRSSILYGRFLLYWCDGVIY